MRGAMYSYALPLSQNSIVKIGTNSVGCAGNDTDCSKRACDVANFPMGQKRQLARTGSGQDHRAYQEV